MRRYSTSEKPRLKSPLFQTADAEWRKLLEQIEEMNGVGSHLPREDGGLVPVRFNGSAGQLEYLKGGKWQAMGSPAQPPPAPPSAIRNAVGADGKLYHNSLAGIGPNDHHDAVSVADSDTLDLSVSGQQVSGSVRTQQSITSDASGLKLSGDSASPGNSKYYGTDAGGTKGFHALPTGTDDHKVLVNSLDTTPEYLIDKIRGSNGIVINAGEDEGSYDVWIENRYQMSITVTDANGMKLVNDSASPGNNKLYGTNGSGTKGWYDQPSGSLPAGASGQAAAHNGTSWQALDLIARYFQHHSPAARIEDDLKVSACCGCTAICC